MVLRVGPSSKIGFEFSEVTRLDMIEHLSAERRERRRFEDLLHFHRAPLKDCVHIFRVGEKSWIDARRYARIRAVQSGCAAALRPEHAEMATTSRGRRP